MSSGSVVFSWTKWEFQGASQPSGLEKLCGCRRSGAGRRAPGVFRRGIAERARLLRGVAGFRTVFGGRAQKGGTGERAAPLVRLQRRSSFGNVVRGLEAGKGGGLLRLLVRLVVSAPEKFNLPGADRLRAGRRFALRIEPGLFPSGAASWPALDLVELGRSGT